MQQRINMKKIRFFSAFLVFLFSIMITASFASSTASYTVRTGTYITSIHDIDFKQKEYSIDLWLWLKYNKREFDFVQNLEIHQAMTVNKLFSTIDSSTGRFYQLMKLQCVLKDSSKIINFPFDRQNLRFSLENSQNDSRELVFTLDTLGKHYNSMFTLRGRNIDSLDTVSSIHAYETTFDDETLTKPHVEYSTFRV